MNGTLVARPARKTMLTPGGDGFHVDVSVSPSLVANCVDGKPRRRRGSHGGETLAAASGSTSEVPLAGTLRPAGRPPLGRVTLTSMALLTGEDHQGLATALYAQAGLAAQ